jgi:DNA-binding GntR family transcriptional regulator
MESGLQEYVPTLGTTAEEEAYKFVLYRIRMGSYKAGDRLIPEDIAAEISTSRMPVREAFRRLATEGLITIRANRGAIVRGLNVQEMEEVFNMRAVMEGLAGRMIQPKITREHIAQLTRLIEIMEESDRNLSKWVTAHRNFHEYLAHISASGRLIKQIESLHSVVEPHMRLWLEIAHRPMSSRDDHMTIIHALEAGDALATEAVIREHIDATIPALRNWMTADVKIV